MSFKEAGKLGGDILKKIGYPETPAIKKWFHEKFHAAAGEDKLLSAKEVKDAVGGALPGGKNWCHRPKVADVVKFFDKNADGKINKDEFLGGMGKVAKWMDFTPGKADVAAAEELFKRAD